MTPEELVRQALAAMKFAYVPYSGFTVGAALLLAVLLCQHRRALSP